MSTPQLLRLLFALIAGLIAWRVARSDFLTSRYRRTAFLLRRSWNVRGYAAIYATAAVILQYLLYGLLDRRVLDLRGTELHPTLLQAITVGLLTRPILHLTIWNKPAGEEVIPIGIRTILLAFEPHLIGKIDREHFQLLNVYLQTWEDYFDLPRAKDRATGHLPTYMTPDERDGFKRDIDDTKDRFDLLYLYLSEVGQEPFEAAFRFSR